MSGDLGTEISSRTLDLGRDITQEPNVDKGMCVESVVTIDTTSAIDGFLAERQDLLAMLSSRSGSDADQPSPRDLFCLVTRPAAQEGLVEDVRIVHIISIPQRCSSTTSSLAIQPLTSWILPSTKVTRGVRESRSQYYINSRLGILQELSGDSFNVYDLNTVIPTVISRFPNPQDPTLSFLPVSDAISMLSSKNQSTLYNFRFQSMESIQSTGTVEVTDKRNRKRKSVSSEDSREFLELMDYFKTVSLAVGLWDNAIWGFHITQDANAGFSKKRKISKLSESIGRGHGTILSSSLPSDQDCGWQKHSRSLDQLAAARNVKGFEERFFKALSNQMRSTGEEDRFGRIVKHTDYFACVVNGTPFDPSVMLGNFREGLKARSRSRGLDVQTRYALNKTFSWTKNANHSEITTSMATSAIEVTFMPSKIFAWLVLEGYMTPEATTESLQYSTDKIHGRKVTTTGMIDCIAEFDPSLIHLSYLLLHSSSLDCSGTMHALGSIIRSFKPPQPLVKNRFLTHGTSGSENNILEPDVKNKEIGPPHHQTFAPPHPNLYPPLRAATLKKCLLEFARICHPIERALSMKAHLTPTETISLIELLRIALAQGGWVSRYLDLHPADSSSSADQTPDNSSDGEAITDICGLLNCALDALGTGAWLADLSLSSPSDRPAEVNTDTIISSLRREISAALEGVQCCAFFNGFLKDFLRFEHAAIKSAVHPGNAGRRGGHDVLLGISDAVVGNIQTTDGMLPLGLKTVQRVEMTKIGAGGEIQMRSAREIGMKLSRRMGKYCFESIRV